jgi:hypothetical protein
VDVDNLPYLVVAVVEVDSKERNYVKKFESGRQLVKFNHRWGAAQLLKSAGRIEVVLLKKGDGKPLETVAKRFQKRYDEVFKETKPDPRNVLDLARWALAHGLIKKCVVVMDKLAELDKASEIVKAYKKVKAELERAPGKDDVAAAWKRKMLDGYKITTTDKHHYVLLHNSSTDGLVEVKEQLDRLEDSFRGFYYWWALRGVALPVPRQRQLAVLTDRGDDMARLRKHLTASPAVADSFVARRENLSVLSAKRGDQPYHSLSEFSKPYWQKGFVRSDLIKGVAKRGVPRAYQTSLQDIFTSRLLALMLTAMENEWEATSISHDTSRQLMFSSGLLERKVHVPEWIQFGMASFFETPLQAPWAGVGAPSTYWLPRFKEYRKDKKLGATAYDTLRRVVTDGYFRGKAAKDKKEERQARAAAWALTYYLAQTKLSGLQLYFKELNKQPRDIELNEKVLLGCFARAFGCVTHDKQVDEGALRRLAYQWDDYITRLRLEAESMHKDIRDAYAKMTGSGGKPDGGKPAGDGKSGGTSGGTPNGTPPGTKPPSGRPGGGGFVPGGGGGGVRPPSGGPTRPPKGGPRPPSGGARPPSGGGAPAR